jgi:hypothetical protein
MSVKILTTKPGLSQLKGGRYHEEGELIEAGSMDFIIPDSVSSIGIQVIPSDGASAAVYATEFSEASINAGTAEFNIWDNDIVTSSSEAVCDGAVTAIRVTQIGAGRVKYALDAK